MLVFLSNFEFILILSRKGVFMNIKLLLACSATGLAGAIGFYQYNKNNANSEGIDKANNKPPPNHPVPLTSNAPPAPFDVCQGGWTDGGPFNWYKNYQSWTIPHQDPRLPCDTGLRFFVQRMQLFESRSQVKTCDQNNNVALCNGRSDKIRDLYKPRFHQETEVDYNGHRYTTFKPR
jgi:hypothetical protein